MCLCPSVPEIVLRDKSPFQGQLNVGPSGPGFFTYFLDYLAGIGKSMDLGFGENLFAIHNNIKDSSAARDQLCLHIKFFEQFFRQTGGSGFVVSYTAVVDFNLHNIFLRMAG